ncbi:MAG TPA: ATP-binding protein [Gemmatimonadaceae bacterium]|jgi:two-component system cell cycle sensor histidine kinase/response regulator CckA|nr:ATP-binding protein [Gemmatimonadaceae bacterium]
MPRSAASIALPLSRTAPESYRLLFLEMPVPMFIYDVATLAIRDVNEAAIGCYGYSRDAFLALTLSDLERTDAPELLNRFAARNVRTDVTHRTRDGRTLIVNLTFSATTFDDRPAHLVVVDDVTAHRRLEEQLRQAQKMDAVGRLAGGIAHDFNNLLTVISASGELLGEDLPPDHAARPEVESILTAVAAAGRLTSQLLTFSRKQLLRPRVLDLNTIVFGLEAMLRRLIPEDIDIVTRPADDQLPIVADAGQLEQVLMNLAANARDAMPGCGTLTVETGVAELDACYTQRRTVVVPGRYAVLAVTDTGCGMDRHVRDHLFEPFFTTKALGSGTGLGLATVYGIVKQSGGYIWVYSEVGLGTTFKIYLPLAQPDVNQPTPPVPAPSARGNTETILVVEDEPAVRALTARVLVSQGYSVITAATGAEALEAARTHAGPIALVLTDLVMPGGSGRAAYQAVAAVRPDVRPLYMSGYTDDDVIRRGLIDATTPFVQKPFTAAGLSRAVRDVLDRLPDTR